MSIRTISLIVAIIAGLAAGGLNFVKVKEKITTLKDQRDTEEKAKTEANQKLAKTSKELKDTSEKLKTTEENLKVTTEEKDKAVTEVADLTKVRAKLTDDLAKTTKARDEAQFELKAYKDTDLKPEEIIAFRKNYKNLQDSLAGAQDENVLLGKKITSLQNELNIYKTPEYVVALRADLKGKILVTDPKWNFVILDIGQDQGVLDHGELLVNRNGKLVAKVKVRTVQKDRSVANVLPGWQLGEVMEGDVVIPAHPAL
jgi:hypothetical protein